GAMPSRRTRRTTCTSSGCRSSPRRSPSAVPCSLRWPPWCRSRALLRAVRRARVRRDRRIASSCGYTSFPLHCSREVSRRREVEVRKSRNRARRACVYAFEAGKSGGPRAHLVHSRLPTNARPPPRRRPRPFARAGSGGPEKGADRPISPAGAVGTSVRVFPGRKRGLSVRKAWFCCALVGVAVLSSALTAVLLPRRQVVVVAATAKAAEADRV